MTSRAQLWAFALCRILITQTTLKLHGLFALAKLLFMFCVDTQMHRPLRRWTDACLAYTAGVQMCSCFNALSMTQYEKLKVGVMCEESVLGTLVQL